jgi:GNAT superfamily N-acetyltransferase
MSTFAEPPADDLVVAVRDYADPDVVALVEQVQAEYVRRYGGPDATPVDPAQFAAPHGRFLVGYLGATAVACGGWRALTDGPPGSAIAEVKRMFVVPSARRRGLALRVLAALERSAAAAGRQEIWLETGYAQPEAIALYQREGYRPITPFGHYRDTDGSIHLGKKIAGD